MASHNFQPFSRGKLWSDAESIARIVSDTGTQYEEQVRARLEGYDAAGLEWRRIAVDASGRLTLAALSVSADIQIGAVEIKNASSDDRATVSAAGALKVDGSAVTQPVSGTFWQATQPVSLADSVSVQQATAASLNAQVVGNVAHAASDSGNPVKIGGVYRATIATLTDGQRSDLAVDTRQAVLVTLMNRNSATSAFTSSAPGRIDPTGTTTQPVSLAASVSAILTAETTKVIGTVNQGTGQGKTLLFGVITQGAAGTTELVAADATKKVKLVSYVVVLDAAGSVKFTDGTADLTGVMPMAANGGVASPGQPAAHLLETAAVNRPLNIVTVTGKAFGHFSYYLEA